MIEYRLDYQRSINLVKLESLSTSHILTYRDAAEGGKNPISDAEKLKLIKYILKNSNCYIDCEYAFLMRNPTYKVQPSRLILSLHTDLTQIDIIKDFLNTDIQAAYYKLAFIIKRIEDIDIIQRLLPIDKKGKMILVPMQEKAFSARLFYPFYNSIGTYVYDKQKIAKGQLSLELSRRCRLHDINSQTWVFVITGGKQITESLSVVMLNHLFKRTNMNNVVLPLIATSPYKVISEIQWLKQHAILKGVIITMPFKQDIARLVKGKDGIYNSWKPATDDFLCSDEYAMKQALDKLQIGKKSSVLVFGTGATSQIAQTCLKGYGVSDLTIISRSQLEDFNQIENVRIKDFWSIRNYDLLINCTPYGTHESDNTLLLPRFKALIDLPYTTSNTSLTKYAVENHIPHVDGIQFWQWQASVQMAFFGIDLNLNRLLH